MFYMFSFVSFFSHFLLGIATDHCLGTADRKHRRLPHPSDPVAQNKLLIDEKNCNSALAIMRSSGQRNASAATARRQGEEKEIAANSEELTLQIATSCPLFGP